ncbi:MAG: hypothetical protein Q9183_005644, partial [Haloplaca sp. 2 TL-2023]
APADTMPRSAACFDLLPAEIRVQIYHQLLAVDEEDERIYRIYSPQTLVSIVQVSSKLRREAMPVLFGRSPIPFSIHITESTVTFQGKRLHHARLHKFTPPMDLSNIKDWAITIDDPLRCVQVVPGVVRAQNPMSRIMSSLQWVFRRLRNVSSTPPTLQIRLETPRSCNCPGCFLMATGLSNHPFYRFHPPQALTTGYEFSKSKWFNRIIVLHFQCPQPTAQGTDVRRFLKTTRLSDMVRDCMEMAEEDVSFQAMMMEVLIDITTPYHDTSHVLKHLVDATSDSVAYGGLKFDHTFDDAMQCLHNLLQAPTKSFHAAEALHDYPQDFNADQVRDFVSKKREKMIEEGKSYARLKPKIQWDHVVSVLANHNFDDWFKTGPQFLQFIEDCYIALPQGLPVPWLSFFRDHLEDIANLMPRDDGDEDEHQHCYCQRHGNDHRNDLG